MIGTIALWLVRLATGGVLVGVYQFNTNDIGEPYFTLSFSARHYTCGSCLVPELMMMCLRADRINRVDEANLEGLIRRMTVVTSLI